MNDLDNRISKEIKEAIDKEMSESAMDVNVVTRDGHVTLSGIVDTLAEKRAAEEIATNIKKIKSIENCITISTDGYIPDKEIEMEVMNKLTHSDFSDKLVGVSANVSDGVAILKGTVETLRDKKRAVNEAERALGIKDVVSNIKIETKGSFDDSSITNKVTQRLSTSELSIPDIFTETENGVVKISGHVNNRREMELAVELAESIEGVIKVENKLRVR